LRREAVDGRHEKVEQPSKSTDSQEALPLTAEDPLFSGEVSNETAVDSAQPSGETTPKTDVLAPHDTADSALSDAVPAISSGEGYFPEGADTLPKGEAVTEDAHKDEETYDDRDEGYPPKYKGEIPVDVSDEAVRVGRETLQKMVSLITEDATVVAETDEDRLLLRVEGGNSGVLIGRRGQTLEAMQFLTDKIINRCSESRVRLKVDIEGYMETRKANLQSLAFKMADKAKKTGKPATINQMTAQDRRIVHLALKDDHRVRTQSMGDGYYRRLVIFPKKGSWKRRKPYRKQANDS
jgi:spoIIIJ-associated protein